MVEIIDIKDIKPASYNPRKITPEQLEQLKESLKACGFIVPILVNDNNNTIIAGHQRTNASSLVGIDKVPCIRVKGLQIGDEIKFNQIHNASDVENQGVTLDTDGLPTEKFIEVDNSKFTIKFRNAISVKEICKIIMKYGNVLSCVVCRGQVMLGGDYVKACELLRIKVNTYIADDSKYDDIKFYFGQEYGQYCYEKISRNTFVQGLAQMHRSTVKTEKRQNASSLYTNCVLPYIENNKNINSVLDFGCGKGDYINALKAKYKAVGVEFYNNNGKQINVSKGNRQVDELIAYLKDRSTFDVVVCDSVLNSVDSMQAERSVLDCLNLFTSEIAFISGRPIDCLTGRYNLKHDRSRVRYLEFLDDDNFSANFREGQWYFQHWHSKDQIRKSLEESGFEILDMWWRKFSDSWQVKAKKVKELPKQRYIDAIDFEFNLPLPNGKRYGRNDEVRNVLNF